MLTKNVVTGSIEILEDGRLQVREDTIIIEDQNEISVTYLRYVLNPGDDVSDKSERIQDVAYAVWTPEVVEDWKIKEEQLRQNLPS